MYSFGGKVTFVLGKGSDMKTTEASEEYSRMISPSRKYRRVYRVCDKCKQSEWEALCLVVTHEEAYMYVVLLQVLRRADANLGWPQR